MKRLRKTTWLYVNIAFAWVSMMTGLYLIKLLTALIDRLEGKVISTFYASVLDIAITILLFLLWLFLWRALTVKSFHMVLAGRSSGKFKGLRLRVMG